MPPIVEFSENFRVFINLSSSACASRCSYCYVPKGHPSPYAWDDIQSAIEHATSRDAFVPGRDGTIVTFGGHTEIFRGNQLVELLVRALRLVCPLGNPVQFSTKQFVSRETLLRIEACCKYRGQIAMFVSCASVVRSAEVESGADSPAKRWLTLSNQRTVGLPRAILIKPWLGSTTKRELASFARLANSYDVDAVCLGTFYVTPIINEKMVSITGTIEESHGTATHPLIKGSHFSIAPLPDVISEFQTYLNCIPLFVSSICISAQFADVSCPLHRNSHCLDVFKKNAI